MATWPASDSPWQSGGQTSYAGDHNGGRTGGHGDSFIISGMGVPTAPLGCSFNGASCEFSILDLSGRTTGG
jgi:hypothetical protein